MADEHEAAGDERYYSSEEFDARVLERVNAVLRALRAEGSELGPDFLTAVALTTVGAAMSRDLGASESDVASQVHHVYENEFRVLSIEPDAGAN